MANENRNDDAMTMAPVARNSNNEQEITRLSNTVGSPTARNTAGRVAPRWKSARRAHAGPRQISSQHKCQ
jgi:hypothetical protein